MVRPQVGLFLLIQTILVKPCGWQQQFTKPAMNGKEPDMTDFMSLAAARESCRAYKSEPVPKEKLLQCLEAARIAPSACNSQPWHFTVVTNPELLAQVATCTQSMGMNRFASECPALVIVSEQPANLSAKLGGLVKKQQYAQIDVGIAAAHFCLEATDQGLSTCILGWFDEKQLHRVIKLPSGRVRLILCVGYATDAPLRPKKRKIIEEVASFVE